MRVKKKKKRLVLVVILVLILGIVAYFGVTAFIASPGSAVIISGGEVHEGSTHYFFFRSGPLATAGAPHSRPESLVRGLEPIPIEEDFQIRLQGWPRHPFFYRFYRLGEYQWESVLAVNPANLNEIFLTHGDRRRDEWEQVYAESFLDLLEPGEYMLEIIVSWGTSRHGRDAQYVFRLTV